MPYIVNNTSGDTTIYIQDGTVDRSTAVDLVGRNTPDYGEIMNENFVGLLENFANNTPPSVTDFLNGQLWYDTDSANELFRVWDGTNWTFATRLKITNAEPGSAISRDGNMYYDSGVHKTKIKVNGEWIDNNYAGEITDSYGSVVGVGSPTMYGTRVRTIFLRDLSGVDHAVLAFMYANNGGSSFTPQGETDTRYGKETIMMIVSEHDEFEVLPSGITLNEGENINWYPQLNQAGGIGHKIRKGINIRCDATQNPVPFYGNRSQRADQTYALNTGVWETNINCDVLDSVGSETIMAANVFHSLKDAIPQINNHFTLGNVSNQWSDLYTGNVHFSNSILPLSNTTTIGSNTAIVHESHTQEIYVYGNIHIQGDNVSLGSNTAPINEGWFYDLYASNNLTLGNTLTNTHYNFPNTAETNHLLVTNSSNTLVWVNYGNVVTSITEGAAISTSRDYEVNITGDPTSCGFTVAVDYDKGLDVNGSNQLVVDLGDFTTDDLDEGNNNLYFTVARARNSISEGSGISYNSTTGVISIADGEGLGALNAGAGLIKSNDTTIDVNPGDGIKIVNDKVTVDATSLVTDDLIIGSDNTWATVVVDAVGDAAQIKVTSVKNSAKLGDQLPSYYLNTSASAQTKSGELTAGAIRLNNGHISNTAGSTVTVDDALSVKGSITATGDICSTSDARTKTNIEPLTGCLERVLSMQPVSFDQNGKRSIGYIAQDIQQIQPEVVNVDENGMLSLDYGKLGADYSGSIHELVEIINNLRSDLDRLRAELGR